MPKRVTSKRTKSYATRSTTSKLSIENLYKRAGSIRKYTKHQIKGSSHELHLKALIEWLTSQGVGVKIGRSAGKHIECTTLVNNEISTKKKTKQALIVFKKDPKRSINTTFYIAVHEAAHLRVPSCVGLFMNETIAESTSFLVCKAFKLDVAASSASYLAPYVRNMPPEMLIACGAISKRLCNDIVAGLSGVLHKWEH